MISSRDLVRLACLVGFGATLGGCTTEATVTTRPNNNNTTLTPGAYELIWTVGNTTSAGACATLGADQMVVTLYDSFGIVVSGTPASANCENFNIRFDGLVPDVYSAEAVLVDANGFDVSATLDLVDIDVGPGETITSDVDFPL